VGGGGVCQANGVGASRGSSWEGGGRRLDFVGDISVVGGSKRQKLKEWTKGEGEKRKKREGGGE